MSRGRHVIKGRYCCTTWYARVTLKSRARTLEACHVTRVASRGRFIALIRLQALETSQLAIYN